MVATRRSKRQRGGLRWSDRREDFRTEILGLVKAQQVKNAVIVPVGSKGGFVVKQAAAAGAIDRDAWAWRKASPATRPSSAGLLDITDNLSDDKVVPPRDVVIADGDDPYLVVAADKGTATFSDIANGVSDRLRLLARRRLRLRRLGRLRPQEDGHHRARRLGQSVKRHFREMGKDIQNEDFTVVGVGDMSGDVFGNGMLLSKHIKLVARLQPPAHLRRSRSRSGGKSWKNASAVRPAAIELDRLRREADLQGRRRLRRASAKSIS